jgi:hypothetical protein
MMAKRGKRRRKRERKQDGKKKVEEQLMCDGSGYIKVVVDVGEMPDPPPGMRWNVAAAGGGAVECPGCPRCFDACPVCGGAPTPEGWKYLDEAEPCTEPCHGLERSERFKKKRARRG